MYLVAGLGNPGREHARNRHNAGWMVVDELARRHGGSWRGKFAGQMAEVRVGQSVLFRPNDGGPEAAGRVSHLSPEVNDKTRRVQVHAEVPNEDRRLRPNTFGTGRILVAEHRGVVVVPAAAVQSDGDTPLVFVKESEKSFQARPVRPGAGRRWGDIGKRRGAPQIVAACVSKPRELTRCRCLNGADLSAQRVRQRPRLRLVARLASKWPDRAARPPRLDSD